MSGISKRVSGSWVSDDYSIMKNATDTITTLPATIYADGNNATIGISGNTVQNGTPTPDSPIMPEECGERTGNLCIQFEHGGIQQSNGSLFDSNARLRSNDFIQLAAGTYTISGAYNFAVRVYDTSKNYIAEQSSSAWSRDNLSFTISDSFIKIVVANYDTNTYIPLNAQVMLNSGSTALPYEPYGYKIPILSNSTTTPIYLGEVETTRAIKKLVFDGTENWQAVSGFFYLGSISPDYLRARDNITYVCTHYTVYPQTGFDVNVPNKNIALGSDASNQRVYVKDDDVADVTAFKAYLAAQYANGTPVTVWYVLATPETAVVNEPLMKIGGYADEVSGITIPTIAGADSFDVLTTLKPSEVSLSYTGWHDATVKEWDGSQWNE